MSYTSGFFDAVDTGGGYYDRVYNAAAFAHYFSLLVKNGVFPDPSTGLQVKASSTPDMHVSVQPGNGWVNGYYLTVPDNDSEVLTLPTANPSLHRIDSVIMGLNYAEREIQLYIRPGVASTNPVAVSLQRDGDVYELELAQILVGAGTASISQANITDMRSNTSRCGIVTGTIDQIDTTDLFAQYNAAFQAWFEDIQGQLSGDVAANLQLQINSLKTGKADTAVTDSLQKQVTSLDTKKVNVSDKATKQEVASGISDSKWVTPNGAVELFGKVGDVKISKRTDLGDKWALCNGQFVDNPSEEFLSISDPVETFDTFSKSALSHYTLEAHINEHFFWVYTDSSSHVIVEWANTYDGVRTRYTSTNTYTPHRFWIDYGNSVYMVCIQNSGNNLAFIRIGSSLALSSVVENNSFYSKGSEQSTKCQIFKFINGVFFFFWGGGYNSGTAGRSTDGTTWTTESTPHWNYSSTGYSTIFGDCIHIAKYGTLFVGSGYSNSSGTGVASGVLYYGNWPTKAMTSLRKVSYANDLGLSKFFEYLGEYYAIGNLGIYKVITTDSAPSLSLVYAYTFNELTDKNRVANNRIFTAVQGVRDKTYLMILFMGYTRATNTNYRGYSFHVFDITNGVTDSIEINTNFQSADGSSSSSEGYDASTYSIGGILSTDELLRICASLSVQSSKYLPITPTISPVHAYAYIRVK